MIQETRRWDDNKESSHAMRSKEDAKGLPLFPGSGSSANPYLLMHGFKRSVKSQPELREEKLDFVISRNYELIRL